MIENQRSVILKSPKKKNSVVGLLVYHTATGLLPFSSSSLCSTPHPICFSRPVPPTVTHSKSLALLARGRQHPRAMFHLPK